APADRARAVGPRPAGSPRPGRPLLGSGARRPEHETTSRRTGKDQRMTTADVQRTCERLLDEVEKAIVGKRETLELVLLGFLANGNVLLEDVPGLAKTLMARSFAETIGLRFARVQFTPDL